MALSALVAPRRPRSLGRTLAWVMLLAAVGLLVAYPIVYLQRPAFEDGAASIRGLNDVPDIGKILLTTAFLGIGATVIAIVFGVALAVSTCRLPRRIRGPLAVVPLLPLAIPAVAFVTGWAFLLSPKIGYANVLLRKLPGLRGLDTGPFDVYSVPWIIIITGLSLTSFVFVFCFAHLVNSTEDYESAASVSGASTIRSFVTITLPLLRPVIVYSGSMVFLLSVGQFTAPLLLGRAKGIDVLTTEMFRLREVNPIDYGLIAALGLPLLILGLAIILSQQRLAGDQTRYVVHTGKAARVDTRTSWWGLIPVGLYGLVCVVMPLLALLYVALSPFWSAKMTLDNLTLRHFDRVLFDSPKFTEALGTSIKGSLVAIAIILPIGYLCALAMLRRSRVNGWTRRPLEVATQLPLVLPASLFGFGILFAYSHPPFELYGSIAVIVVTYVTLMIPYATRGFLIPLITLGDSYVEASRVSGAGSGRTFWRVTLPLVRRGVAAGVAIIVILLFHEFAATLMVRSTHVQVLGSLLYEYWTNGVYPEVAVVAIAMVVATLIGVAIAFVIGGRAPVRPRRR